LYYHYHLLCSCIESRLGRPITPEELTPTEETRQQNRKQYGDFGASLVTRLASMGLGAEYMSHAVNEVVIEMGEPDVAEAYRKINRDEAFHVQIGKVGLERYALTREDQTRAWEAAMETAKLHVVAYEALFNRARAAA